MVAVSHLNIAEQRMQDTYLALGHASEKLNTQQNIHRLGTHVNSSNGAQLNGGADGVGFAFGGTDKPLSEREKSEAIRFALEEVYEEITGSSAKDIADADLKNRIGSHYRDSQNNQNAKIILTIFKIDPDNRSDSFAEALGKIETFTPQSKKKLVADAFLQLENLDQTKADEIHRLSDAIAHMGRRGAFSLLQLDDGQQKVLGDLVNRRPDIRAAIAKADERYSISSDSLKKRPDVQLEIERGRQQRAKEPARSQTPAQPPGSVRILGRGATDDSIGETDQVSQNASTQATMPNQPIKPESRVDGGSLGAEAQRQATAARAYLAGRSRGVDSR
jgi:hypothetical protein